MSRKTGAFAVLAVVGLLGASPTAADFSSLCGTYADFPVLFVGRAGERVTYRISGEPRIEEAKRNLDRVKEEVAEVRASLLPKVPDVELETELEIRIIRAEAEVETIKVRYPEPQDVSLIPVQVERAFRGVKETTLMLDGRASGIAVEPGELYLIGGARMPDTPFRLPDIPDAFDYDLYVIPLHATPVAEAEEDLRFLESAASGATVLGNLMMFTSGEGRGASLGGIRMTVSSGSHMSETTTREDGSFTVSAIPSGHLEIKPLLRDDLTVVNRSSLTFDVVDGGCNVVNFAVALNGRVRGRVMSATGTSLEGVELVLGPARRPDRDGNFTHYSEDRITTIRPNPDGTYEFFGQTPGSYFLSARHVRMENGKERYDVTFYPGTSNIADAREIVVGRATVHEGVDFLVKTE